MLTTIAASCLAMLTALSPPPDVSADLEPLREQLGVPALAIGVANLEGVKLIGACGRRCVGEDEPIHLDDRYHLGSLSKSMTALLAATFVEEGKLDWNTTFEKATPETNAHLSDAHRAVTLEQLLAHRSGLPDDRHDIPVYAGLWMQAGSPDKVRAWGVVTAFKRDSVTTPGQQMVYANSNYLAAGHMLETVAGESYETLLRERVFERVGMPSAGFGEPFETYDTPQARGHIRNGRHLVPAPKGPLGALPPAMNPAGGVHCSIQDLASYARAHLLGLCDRQAPFDAAMIKRLHEDPEADGYALGWAIANLADGRRISLHAGSNGRWFATIWIDPTKQRAIVATMNATPGDDVKDIYLAIEKYVDSAPWARQSNEP